MTIEPTTTPNVLGSCRELTGTAAGSSQEQLHGAYGNVHPGTSLDSVHDKSGLPLKENRKKTDIPKNPEKNFLTNYITEGDIYKNQTNINKKGKILAKYSYKEIQKRIISSKNNKSGEKSLCETLVKSKLRNTTSKNEGLPSTDCGENRHRTLLCCKCGNTHKIPIDCGDRLCLSCNSRRARKLRKKWFPAMAIILKDISRHKLKFLTLTFKSKNKIQVDKLKKDFQRLRDRQIYKKAWAGGIYDIETGYKNGMYTLHIHAVVKGDYIAQKVLSSNWHDITGDSFIVDIRAVKYRDNQRYDVAVKSVLNYLMKYITKPADSGVDWYDYNEAFGGRRLIQGWGCFYNVLSNDTLPFMCPDCEHSSWEILENLNPPHPRLIFNRPELSLDSFSDSSQIIQG